ncbi:MAG: hypothetical protein GWN84_26610 [Gammaproteobacteria bacterium]|nr:hypothetical protein [Gammaproteobacteria bacterium]NIR85969.1 hypothetical protein [Gammaproteobacteria bacterium]NIR91960.1 hypothetical protein [Gammaproteobacteria bacterium]NIU07210.1 hypothetical protein [Gammaproteobacteria bacterium]NIV74211.1 hypothetical protein [Gammaproteobacteria bacterium]
MSDSDVKADDAQTQTSLGQDLLRLARYWLGGRWGLLAVGALAAAGGLALSWDWLVAAGLAPLVIGVLPCVAMCAAGLCMKGLGSHACDASGAKEDTSRQRSASAALPPSEEVETVIAQPSGVPAQSPATAAREEATQSSRAGGEGVPAESPHVSGRNVNP